METSECGSIRIFLLGFLCNSPIDASIRSVTNRSAIGVSNLPTATILRSWIEIRRNELRFSNAHRYRCQETFHATRMGYQASNRFSRRSCTQIRSRKGKKATEKWKDVHDERRWRTTRETDQRFRLECIYTSEDVALSGVMEKTWQSTKH